MGAGDAPKEYAAGFAAGVAMVVVGHPFDTVKVRLQAYNTKTQVKEYNSALHCTSQILRNEGVKGLYRGASSTLVGMAIESSLSFGIYSQMKRRLQGERESIRPQLQVIVPSAAYAGAIISFILGPTELIKCRMQVQGVDSSVSKYVRYDGPLDCIFKTFQSEGIKGIFRGGCTTLLRESIGTATFFSTYELSRYFMHGRMDPLLSNHSRESKMLMDVGIGIITGGLSGMAVSNQISNPLRGDVISVIPLASLPPRLVGTTQYESRLCKCTSRLCFQPRSIETMVTSVIFTASDATHNESRLFWLAVLPLDVAKTVIQTSPDLNSTRSPFRTLKSIYGRVGLTGCYAGLGPTLARAFPANAAAIVAWEVTAKLLGVRRE